MAGNPVDPLQALSAALAVPPDSKEQADLLGKLRESLEAHPSPIPILCKTLIKTVSGSGDSVLKRWVLDLLHFALCRSSLSLEVRTDLASQSLDTLTGLLYDPNPFTVKLVVQCFATVYPLLFRVVCTNRTLRQQWDVLTQSKARILEFVWAPNVAAGIRLAAVKFMQRVILVQTRPLGDPRLQNKSDIHLAMCPADHPFVSAAALEAEGVRLLENVITILYTNQNPDIVSAVINSWAPLVKQRPGPLIQIVLTALAQWTPAALAGLPVSTIKSVEKTIRSFLLHISRSQQGVPFLSQINEALAAQSNRMDRAALEEKNRKAALAAQAEASRKRPASQELPTEPKRARLDAESAANAASFLAGFDFTSLPSPLVTDLIVANLQAFSESALQSLVQVYRQSRGGAPPAAATSAPETAPQASVEKSETPDRAQAEPAAPAVKEEPVDPLQMDIDEEEMEYEPDRLNLELSGGEGRGDEDGEVDNMDSMNVDLQLADFKLPSPKDLTEDERNALIRSSINRIQDDANVLADASPDAVDKVEGGAPELWMLLLVRMVTRMAKHPTDDSQPEDQSQENVGEEAMESKEFDLVSRQDLLRQRLCDYIMADFPGRVRLATTWMNEEWYNDRIRCDQNPSWRTNYEIWLSQIVATYQTHLDAKDRTFSRFLLDIPSLPPDVLELLRDLCLETERMEVGFTALREFVLQRPSMRAEAMNILLELTTHSERATRKAAILTVKRWVPGVQPMDTMIRDFAHAMLRRLRARPRSRGKDVREGKDRPQTGEVDEDVEMKSEEEQGAVSEEPSGQVEEEDENMEDGQLPQEESDMIQTPYLPEEVELPAKKSQIVQHVELLFALSVKVPDFLDEIFTVYGQMDVSVQETIQDLVTPLIRSLGSSHGKLLTLMRTFPPGAESLALRVLTIFTENGRPSPQLVALVKGLIAERDLDARFLIPIIAEMDKADIVKHLPKIVSILNGKQEAKNLVRSVFSSVVMTPPENFGTVTTNLPRVRQTELLSPAELMVLLHESEKEIGLRSAIEAIGICFSITDVFRSEVLAVVMQQIVDQPVLPTLFLRTVIQAVTTYKSLVGFVSTTLLSRLITKKIWTNPPLWEGFIRCAKIIAPASFGALLQLPKEQLKDLVERQPSLKAGLREYVMKKAGNKAQKAGYLDFLGEEPGEKVPSPSGEGSA